MFQTPEKMATASAGKAMFEKPCATFAEALDASLFENWHDRHHCDLATYPYGDGQNVDEDANGVEVQNCGHHITFTASRPGRKSAGCDSCCCADFLTRRLADQGRLGRLADLFFGDFGRHLNDLQTALNHVENAEVGDDPVDHTSARKWERA